MGMYKGGGFSDMRNHVGGAWLYLYFIIHDR